MPSLIQFHYHNRPGGVTRVMDGYREAFLDIYKGALSFTICHNYRSEGECRNEMVMDTDLFDYHQFTCASEFFDLTLKISDYLDNFFTSHFVGGEEIFLIAHNCNLAKNCALSSALADFVRKNQIVYNMKLFWVMHDFFEDNRVALLNQVRLLEHCAISISKDLYPADCCILITPGLHHYQLLAHLGFETEHLYNPIVAEHSQDDNLRKADAKKIICSAFDNIDTGMLLDKPLIIYPVRCIRRKNIIEAIVLATCYFDGILMLGMGGKSDEDKKFLNRLIDFVEGLDLPVVFDCAAKYPHIFKNSYCSLLQQCYGFVDAVLSTSVEEGFGYSLFEPWLYGLPVFGRKPRGFQFPQGMDTSGFYDYLGVQEQDFADHTSDYQLSTLETIITDQNYKELYFSAIELSTGITRGIECSPGCIEKNRSIVNNLMGFEVFRDAFEVVLKKNRKPHNMVIERASIEAAFSIRKRIY